MKPQLDVELYFHHEWLNLPKVHLYKRKTPIYYTLVEKTGIFKNDLLCVVQLLIKDKPCTITALVENPVFLDSETTYRINSRDFFSFNKYFNEKVPVTIKEKFPYLFMMDHLHTAIKGFDYMLDGSFISTNQKPISKEGPSQSQFEYIYNIANYVYNAEIEYQRYKNSRFGGKLINYIKEQQKKKKSELTAMDYYRIARIGIMSYQLLTGSSAGSDSLNDINIPDGIDALNDNLMTQLDGNTEAIDYLCGTGDPLCDSSDLYNDDPYMVDFSNPEEITVENDFSEKNNPNEESCHEVSFTGAKGCTLCNCGHYIGGDSMSDYCSCGHVKWKHVWG